MNIPFATVTLIVAIHSTRCFLQTQFGARPANPSSKPCTTRIVLPSGFFFFVLSAVPSTTSASSVLSVSRIRYFRFGSASPCRIPPGTSALKFGSIHAPLAWRRSTTSFARIGASSLWKKLYTVALDVFSCRSSPGRPVILLLPALPQRCTY